ncbi:hypothetical protein FHW77_001647 [Agrobacterium sp. RC10-4-1]|uniref:hypothetical protein n=1 Tax=Agrobacterium sp. RC10-4-1 TaxID=2587039 RepID=UPI0015FBFAA8|nr:hypothetical protein [Agrobacterium sp. RC10-4-1]MBA8797965.1 hypothetical protein [Agrobacterium sp. RC10-4-1]
MSEMIERVARAIAKADSTVKGQFDDTEMGDIFWDEWKHLYIPMARAALEAMREPTKAQLEAAEDIVVGYDDFATGDGNIYLGIPGYPQKARDVWTALVDAALKEKA